MIEDKQFSIVLNTIKNNKLICDNDRILLCVSGGIDSICMLDIFARLKEFYKIKLKVVHINHMLRDIEADEEEKFVMKQCEKYKVNCEIRKINIRVISKNIKKSIEETAREQRYKIFKEIMKINKYNKIAVAHNKDDQAETIMIRILRGTGIDGLVGIKYINGNIIRPMLDLSRADIVDYIQKYNIRYVEDSSNKKTIYTRNKIRIDLFPFIDKEYNCNIRDKLYRLSLLAKEDKEIVDIYISNIYKDIVEEKNPNMILIKIDKILLFSDSILKRLIRYAILDFRKNLCGIEHIHIENIIGIIRKNQTGLKYVLPGRVVIEIQYNYIKICDEFSENIYEYHYQVNFPCKIKILEAGIIFCASIIELSNEELANTFYDQNNYTQCFDYGLINSGINIRKRKNGDYIHLSFGKKKLKDYFIDNKIPKSEREKIPLLAKGNEIIWIIGYRASTNYYVNSKTEKIILCNVKLINNKI